MRYSNCHSSYCTSRSVANLTFISQNILRLNRLCCCGLANWFDWVTSFLTRYKYNLNWNIRNISYFIFLYNIDMTTLRPWEQLDFLLEIHIRFFVEKDVIMRLKSLDSFDFTHWVITAIGVTTGGLHKWTRKWIMEHEQVEGYIPGNWPITFSKNDSIQCFMQRSTTTRSSVHYALLQ